LLLRVVPIVLAPAVIFWSNWYFYLLGVGSIFLALVGYEIALHGFRPGFYQRLVVFTVLSSSAIVFNWSGFFFRSIRIKLSVAPRCSRTLNSSSQRSSSSHINFSEKFIPSVFISFQTDGLILSRSGIVSGLRCGASTSLVLFLPFQLCVVSQYVVSGYAE